jgi:hypothetical protein
MQPGEELFRDHFRVPGPWVLHGDDGAGGGKCLMPKSPPAEERCSKISNATFGQWVAPGERRSSGGDDSNREELATAKCHIEVKNKRVVCRLFFVLCRTIRREYDEVLSLIRENRS